MLIPHGHSLVQIFSGSGGQAGRGKAETGAAGGLRAGGAPASGGRILRQNPAVSWLPARQRSGRAGRGLWRAFPDRSPALARGRTPASRRRGGGPARSGDPARSCAAAVRKPPIRKPGKGESAGPVGGLRAQTRPGTSAGPRQCRLPSNRRAGLTRVSAGAPCETNTPGPDASAPGRGVAGSRARCQGAGRTRHPGVEAIDAQSTVTMRTPVRPTADRPVPGGGKPGKRHPFPGRAHPSGKRELALSGRPRPGPAPRAGSQARNPVFCAPQQRARRAWPETRVPRVPGRVRDPSAGTP